MVNKRLDPVDLEYYVAIVTLGSLGAAATELGVSQPGLSKCVLRLERQLGTPLLVRTSRGVSPTSTGEHLLHKAQHILAELDATQRSLRELAGGGVGRVSVGISPSLAAHLMPELCSLAHRERPLLTIQVLEGLYEDLLLGLRQGRMDLVLSTPPIDTPPVEVQVEDLGSDIFAAFAGANHPLTKTSEIDPQALLRHPWVLAPAVGSLRERWRTLFEQQGLVPPHPYVETFSVNMCRTLVAEHAFLSFLPRGLVAEDVRQGRTIELGTPWLRWERRLCLMSLEKRNLTPAANYLRQLVRDLGSQRLHHQAKVAPLTSNSMDVNRST